RQPGPSDDFVQPAHGIQLDQVVYIGGEMVVQQVIQIAGVSVAGQVVGGGVQVQREGAQGDHINGLTRHGKEAQENIRFTPVDMHLLGSGDQFNRDFGVE